MSTRVPLGMAQNLSKLLVHMLKPSCEKIMVVGSVRRCKPLINDVEVVALAQESYVQDLFGASIAIDHTSIDDALDQFAEIEHQGWRVDQRKPDDASYRLRHIHTGLTADLYVIIDKRAWGSNVLMWTGPRQFSKEVVFMSHRRHMHFDNKLLLHDHAKRRTPCRPDCAKIIPLLTEGDVFEKLKITYLTPEEREANYGSGI